MFKTFVLSLVLGGIAVFSYAPFHIWSLAFISFTGLLWLIADKSKKQAMLLGLSWGIAYFGAGVHWVYISIRQYGDLPSFLAVIVLGLLVTYLAIYPMLFALLLRLCNKWAPNFSFKQLVIAAPLIWQFTEFLRGYIMSGFAWLQLGYSQLEGPLRGYFPIVGINGVNLITTALCGFILYSIYLFKQTHTRKNSYSAIAALLLFFVAPLLLTKITWTQIDKQRSANFALVQGNIQQSLRWSRDQLNNTLNTYYSLTKANLKSSDIIIWSEASITDYELNQQSFLQDLDNEAKANNTEIAVGIIDYRPRDNTGENGNVYNTLLVLGEETPYQYPTQNRYQKHHLVPFGEFTPLASILDPIAQLLDIPMSSMTPGASKQSPLIMKKFKFTTAICYEIILSDLILQNFEPDTDFLLTVSNDAWFGDSIGPLQHLQMAQARALEFGRPLIRSTNNGITAVIDQDGNIINQLPQFTTDVLTQKLSPAVGLTPYAKWGNIPYFIALLLMISCLFIKKRQ